MCITSKCPVIFSRNIPHDANEARHITRPSRRDRGLTFKVEARSCMDYILAVVVKVREQGAQPLLKFEPPGIV